MTAHIWSETQVPDSDTERSVGSNVSETCLLEMNKILKPVPLPQAIRLGSVYIRQISRFGGERTSP